MCEGNCKCKTNFTPIFGYYGNPLICYVCGGGIVGEEMLSLVESAFVCDNGCMIKGR
jgi:hypothetical protein